MAVPTYNKDKYYRIMDRTQSNYANLLKRLSKNEKRGNFILIYYSIALIVYPLSVEFYPTKFNETWTSYTSIILSVVVLMYSIINSKAGYSERIKSVSEALNKVKWLKREVGALPDKLPDKLQDAASCCNCDKGEDCKCEQKDACKRLEDLKQQYDNLVSSTEVRDDLDFYQTICQLCKEYGLSPFSGKVKDAEKFISKTSNDNGKDKNITVEEIRGYISEINPCLQKINIIIRSFWNAFLYFAPVIILFLSLCSNNMSLKSLLFFLD